jgi:hypothetical protein
MVFTFSVRNGCASDQAYGDFSFDAMLRLSSGENIGWNRCLLSETSDEAAEGTLAPGQEVRLRIYFETPKDEPATSLRFRERDGRVFISDLSSLQQPRIRAG